jgi:hypothetical protein
LKIHKYGKTEDVFMNFLPGLAICRHHWYLRGGGGGDFDPNLKKSWLCSYVFWRQGRLEKSLTEQKVTVDIPLQCSQDLNSEKEPKPM